VTLLCDSYRLYNEFGFQTYTKNARIQKPYMVRTYYHAHHIPCHNYKIPIPRLDDGRVDTMGMQSQTYNTFSGRMLLPANQKQLYSVLHHCPLPVYM